PCPASVSLPTGQSAGVVNKAPRLLPRKKHGVACDSTYVPAGTLILTGSASPFALMIAPRRLQSFGVASSHCTSAGSSAVVSPSNSALARDRECLVHDVSFELLIATDAAASRG